MTFVCHDGYYDWRIDTFATTTPMGNKPINENERIPEEANTDALTTLTDALGISEIDNSIFYMMQKPLVVKEEEEYNCSIYYIDGNGALASMNGVDTYNLDYILYNSETGLLLVCCTEYNEDEDYEREMYAVYHYDGNEVFYEGTMPNGTGEYDFEAARAGGGLQVVHVIL